MKETELFNTEQTLDEIHEELMKHLTEESSVRIQSDNKIIFYIPENGDVSWWFNDLVQIIAAKIAISDNEIVKFCIEREVDLFDIRIKKL
jgi:hypothetical protein